MHEPVLSAWDGTLQAPLAITGKPRHTGLTMIIDKGLGPVQFNDLLTMGSEHIDLVKLAFGTSMVYPPGVLESKIALACSCGIDIYPGGTLLEIAVMQGKAQLTLDRLCQLGFTAVEISEGTIQLDSMMRRNLIISAKERGLRVLSEVGKKDKNIRLTASQVHEQVASDIDAGSELVIVEGRDSGMGVGVYDDKGQTNDTLVEEILAGVTDANRLMWEAPHTYQQQCWIKKIGNHVNLGNVQPEDVITLAASRAALRGDTLYDVYKRIFSQIISD